MKRILVLIMLTLLLAPPVTADELTYYPDKTSFLAFLNSSSSYTVVPGDDEWTRGWARYVDERLRTIKPHGNDTLVLVGNVYNNNLIASLWNQTALPEEASLLPSLIVLNNTLIITGAEDNIYLTERAFENLWNPPQSSRILFPFIVFIIALLFIASLSGDKSHAGRFYALTFSLYLLWYLTADRPALTDEFLRHLLSSLKFTVGGFPDSPLSALMGIAFRVIPPIEENIVFIHWILILIIISFSFYLAPKRAREMGFLVFSLTFVAPMFRDELGSISGSALGLAAFVVTLSMIGNVTFSPEGWKSLLQTVILSLFTLLAIAINPYLAVIPLIFIIAFPKRQLRNYAYLALTGAGMILIYRTFGIPGDVPSTLDPTAALYLRRFLLDGGLPIATALYSVSMRGEETRIRTKGPTAFLLLITLVYLPMALFNPSLFPYCFVLLAALAVRLLHALTP